MDNSKGKKIWIDLDNTPHVPFFKPIIEELNKRGHSVMLTARDCFQVCALADLHNLPYRPIGRHYGKRAIMKASGLVIRAFQMAPAVLRGKPDLALSHGSRSQMILCMLLRVPMVLMTDYEHARALPGVKPDWMIVPKSLPEDVMALSKERVGRYDGIKEDVYVPGFTPEPGVLQQLGIDENDVVVTVRPPATEAHYFKVESEDLFEATIAWLGSAEKIRMIVLPRNEKQACFVRGKWPELVASRKLIIPSTIIDGLNIIWHSDLVISGGGTMNREAAAMGVPVYSIFRGELGAVDKYLSDTSRLTLIQNVEEMRAKIELKKRTRQESPEIKERPALRQIVDNLESILARQDHGRTR